MTSAGRVRLTITPASSYTIWIACASRLNAADERLASPPAKAALAGDDHARATRRRRRLPATFWHAFWGKSFVQYSNATGDADYLENVYYLATYMIAAGAFGNYPFHFINGV